MTAHELAERAAALGIRLWVEGDRLRYDAPQGVMTDALKAALVEQKAEIVTLLSAPSLERIGRKVLPLSFAQQRLWLLEQLEPGGSIYHSYGAVRLAGTLDAAAIDRSVAEIVRRHEALRTTFHRVDGEAEQRVADEVDVAVQHEDYRALDAGARTSAALALANALRERPFDLTRGPLLRVALIRVADHEHLLVVVLHHIVCDGWSIGVFTRELTALYEAYTSGRTPVLPTLAIQYPDYTLWQRANLTGGRLASELAFWRDQLAGAQTLDLPTDRTRPARPSGRGGEVSIELPAELTARLEALSRSEHATLFMTLLAAFNVLLARYARQTDVAVGVPVANRTRPQLEPLIGFFINMLVVRTDVGGDPTFRELLNRVRARALDAFAHQELPFDQLVLELQPTRDLTRTPFFGVTFAFQNMPPAVLELQGVRLEPVKLDNPTTRFELELHVTPHDGRLRARLNYSLDLFDASTIAAMLRSYRTLLQSIVDAPDSKVMRLALVDDAVRRQMAAWNPASAATLPQESVHRLFERQALATPNQRAAVFGDGALTYSDLNRAANQLARDLQALGVTPGSFVGFCLERSTQTIVTMLAILKAGGVYVPLDPDYPRERLRLMIEDCAAPVVVTEQRLRDLCAADNTALLVLDDPNRSMNLDVSNLSHAGESSDLAYVIYTSGSTGRPKGVCVTHRGIVRLVCGANYLQVEPSDVVAQASNSSFDAATFEIWGALLNGASLAGVTQHEMLTPSALAVRLAQARVSILFITTALFNAVAQQSPRAFSSLRCVLFGGERVDTDAVRTILRSGPPVRLLHVYGPTETTTFASWYEVTEVADDAVNLPIGRAISETALYVLDELQNPVPIGMPGELYIGGAGVARGYLHRPELTAERFVDIPHAGPGVLYRTGDLVRWTDSGEIEFIGRADGQVKLRGFRIELGEIEAALRMHRDVADATVMLLEESNNRRLVGYTVAREGVRLSWDAIRDHLRDKLPAYMVPAAFVQMDALPVNANGKIDRRALPAPAAERSATEAAYVAPRGDLEERIAKIWRDVLELERIGVDDNFFDLGGHSLLLIRVHAKITEVLGRDVPIVDLFEFPTVASLARHLGGDTARADATAPAAEPVASGVESIAIIGMAGRFPGAGDIDTFWRNLRNGVESVRFFTDEELADAGISPELIADPNYVRARGVLDGIELFDAEFFGYTPREAELMDPQHRLFLECAWEALESAGYDPDRYRGAIGVAAGSNLNTYVGNLIANPELMASVGGVQALIGIAGDFLTTRVSYKLNLRGPSLNVQTACSTSLVAVQVACRALAMNDCDIALAGGVSVTVPQIRGHLFMEGGIASPDGHCRAFDRRSQGTVPANGVGVVVLKRLSRAIADGDTIHAVIRGAAVNNDGAQKVGYTAPGVEGQADVVARAMQEARVAPETVSYIETHGTGTALGDPIEIKALTAVYGTRADKTTAIGSLKSNFGHLDAAAGIGGLLKAVLALKHRELPPSLHFESPNPNLDLDRTPFYVNDRLRPWVSDTPRRAGVSSFGIGGTNAHVVLEEAPAVDASSASRPVQVLCVSARTPEALVALAARYADYIDAHPGVPLADIAYTINVGRRAFAHRRVVVCSTHDEAARGLRNVSAAPAVNNEVSGGDQSCVFMFTGQGSQTSGMFRGLYESEPAFRDEIDSMCRAIAPHVGCDLRDVLFGAVTETAAIDQTQFAQPVLFIVEYALARLVQRWGVTPGALIGHSLGEYVAACLAGVMSFDDALRVVAARGRLMQAMAPGAMLAVSLAEAELRDVLSADVSIAALNAPALSVVSGPLDAIAGVEARLTARGVGCQRLKTSHAFHSAMMEPALDAFRRVLQSVSLNAPQIPFVSNLSGTWITGEQATSPEYWVEHLRAPVRFGDGVATLVKQGHAVLLEIGNGEVLTTLARMQPGVTARRIIALRPRGSDSDLAATLSAIGRLWTARVRVDWPALYAGERRLRVALPTYPFQKQRYWIDRRVDAGSRRAARITKRDNGAEWFYEPHWSPAASTPAATEGRWLVFADQNDTSSAITRALEQRGAQLTIVRQGPSFAVAGREYRVDASVRDQFDALMSELGRRGEWPRHVVHLWNAAAVAPSAATAPGFQPPAFFSALHLVQALAASGSTSPIDLHVVCSQSAMVLDTDVVAPEQRTLAGLLAVVPQEYPYMRCARHDLDAGSGTNGSVGAVVDALLGGAVAPVVAYRNGQRLIEHYRPCTPPALKGQPSGRVYLITGGLGGVALAVARRVAAGGNARLALVARTPLPSRGTWDAVLVDPNADDRIKRRIAAMRDLEAAGAQVLVLTADVTDAAAMDAAFSATVARFGGVDVVIHTAGVTRGPGFEPIASLSTTACAQQFAPKVQGAYVLEALVERYRPSACVLTSSLSAVLGGLGMAGYAAANAFLDGFAEARDRRRGTRWVSLNLDGWAFDVERTSDTVLAMTRAEGADAVLRAAMHHDGPPRVVISVADLAARLDRYVYRVRSSQPPLAPPSQMPAAQHARPELASTFAVPTDEVEAAIAKVWQSLLGIDRIGREDNFFDLGGHSLLLVQMHGQLQKSLGRTFPVTFLFESPTIATLASRLSSHVHAAEPQRASASIRARAVNQDSHVAVVAMACRFPGAASPEWFWRNLRDGVESVQFLSDDQLRAAGVPDELLSDDRYVKAAQVLEDVDQFDAGFFAFTPREAQMMDPQHRLFLECAWEALERAGYDPKRFDGAIGVYAGSGGNAYAAHVQSHPELAALGHLQIAIGTKSDFLPARVSYKLNLRGPSVNVQTSCSTSLVAVHEACRGLLSGDCDMALAGGVSIQVPVAAGYLYQEGGILSPDGHCRAFDARAQGTTIGNGAGVVVLRRLSDAIAAGDTILAVVRGSAINNDGSLKVGFTAPSVDGQAAVIAAAQAAAGVEPSTIGYIETHGTGTSLGDPIEIAALTKVFGEGAAKHCALGSLKTNVGHLDAAAGIGGFIKTVLAVHHRELPPSLNFEAPNPEIDFDRTPFYVNTSHQAWPGDGPRRAGVSSFGIGGTNAHVILESADAASPSGPSRDSQILVLSAKTASALDAATVRLADVLKHPHSSAEFADVAYTLQNGRAEFEHRRAVVCRDAAEGAAALLAPRDPRVVTNVAADRPTCVFLFSGQGSQYIGMAAQLYHSEAEFRADVDRCCDLVRDAGGIDLQAVLFASGDPERAADTLRQTAVAQPALFVIEYALARFWMRCGLHPAALGGHSLGEYVAACVAGVFTLEDATRLVVARGQAMQRMPAGAMLAIALDESAMRALLPPTLALAAINGPHAVVVSGPKDDIAAFEAELDRRSIGHRRLETSHAFHSAMMDEACVEFRGQVETVMRRAPQLRMVSNLTGTWLTPEQAQSVDYWVDHLRQPVRFADCVRTLNEINVPVFLEVGPGRTLTTLVRQILPATPVAHIATSLRHPQESTHDQAHLLAEMARLWTVGIEIDWRAFSAGEVRRRVTLPTYPFERQRYWVDRRFESRPSTSAITRPVNDWLWVPSWKEAADPARAVAAFSTDRPRHWLLFTDETGVSSRVASRLTAMGHHVATVAAGSSFAKHAVSAFTINPGRREDYLALVAELDQSAQRPDVVAHFWNVTANAPAEPSQTAPYLDRGFYSLIWLEQALGMGGATRRVTAVSTHTRGVDPSDVVSPVKAAIHGPLLVIPAENSASTSCAIDITAAEWLHASDADLDALVTDIAVGNDAVVAYRHGRRLTPELLPAIVPGRSSAVPPRLRHKGVYLITGGGGGIGRTIARELAARYQARIILVGRHAVSESEVERLTQAGAEVLTIAASVTDEHAMRAAVRTAVSRWGAIHGVIHAAGVAGGGLVQLKTKDAAETVFAPKVTGTQVLAAAIGDCRPDFVALCSSLASVVGSAGQVDYCAANAYLDAFAHDHAQRTGTFTVAINWDAWRDVGMAVETALPGELQRRRAATKVRGISSAEGVDVFFRILSAVSTSQVIVSTANASDVAVGADHVGPQPELAAYARQDAADYVAPADQTEQLLAEVWQQMIGVDRVGRFDDFFKLGGHSLLATRVIAHVKQRCGVDLPLKAFFERPTLSALAERIGELQWAHSGPGAVGVADREEIEI